MPPSASNRPGRYGAVEHSRTRSVRGLLCAVVLNLLVVPVASFETLPDFGRALFHDPNLSANRTQSCATCHDPAHGFIDPRADIAGGAVSRGADRQAAGTRNTPAIGYAAAVPAPTRTAGDWRGGLFLDGRAANLETQAIEPLINPLEMALPDHAAVVARVAENPAYSAALERHFGADVMASTERALAAIGAAIAAFERSPPFVAFDSRYDRFLRGEETLSAEEELGRRLFFSDLMNCMQCHLLEPNTVVAGEVFSNQRYHNIGVPANPALDNPAPDLGLGGRADVADPRQTGKFRTPSLRNIAVTAPYMHNGAFRELATTILFYNQYIVDNDEVGINPETGRDWGSPEVIENIDFELLRQGQPTSDERAELLIAFLRTLTDRRFEHLLPAIEPDAVSGPQPAEEACDE